MKKQMRKITACILVMLMAVSLTACGGGNKKDIIGTWQIVDEETSTEYGFGIEFTKDGKLRYGLTQDMIQALSDSDDKDAQEALEGLDMLMSIDYEIKSDTEMEVTVSALFGLAKESTMIPYQLDGDILDFDGATYKRVE